MSRMRAAIGVSGVSWMRVAVAVGGVALLAGVAGMFVWINDGSNYFDVAVALAPILALNNSAVRCPR